MDILALKEHGRKVDKVFALGVARSSLGSAIFAISTLTFWAGVAIIISAGKNLFGLLIFLYLLATFCV